MRSLVANVSFLSQHLSVMFTTGCLVTGLNCSLEEATEIVFSVSMKKKIKQVVAHRYDTGVHGSNICFE